MMISKITTKNCIIFSIQSNNLFVALYLSEKERLNKHTGQLHLKKVIYIYDLKYKQNPNILITCTS